MFGFMLSLLYATWLVIVESISYEVAYLTATGFLYNWYFWWTVIMGAFVGVFALALPLLGLGGGLQKGGKLGALVGMFLGGVASFLTILIFAIRRGLYVGGAYLLHTALTLSYVDGGKQAIATWDTKRLTLGGILLLIALITSRASSSSSSSKS